jgi:GTPase SAR1 family protein
MITTKPTPFFKLSLLFITASFAFSCQKNMGTDDYAEIYYDYAPGAQIIAEMYCKCSPINDLRKKQFQHSFTVKGDSLSGLLKRFKELKPYDFPETAFARVSILLHNSGRVDTICVGYSYGIKLNSNMMAENAAFTKEVTTLVAQYHGKMMQQKFGKH